MWIKNSEANYLPGSHCYKALLLKGFRARAGARRQEQEHSRSRPGERLTSWGAPWPQGPGRPGAPNSAQLAGFAGLRAWERSASSAPLRLPATQQLELWVPIGQSSPFLFPVTSRLLHTHTHTHTHTHAHLKKLLSPLYTHTQSKVTPPIHTHTFSKVTSSENFLEPLSPAKWKFSVHLYQNTYHIILQLLLLLSRFSRVRLCATP